MKPISVLTHKIIIPVRYLTGQNLVGQKWLNFGEVTKIMFDQ